MPEEDATGADRAWPVRAKAAMRDVKRMMMIWEFEAPSSFVYIPFIHAILYILEAHATLTSLAVRHCCDVMFVVLMR